MDDDSSRKSPETDKAPPRQTTQLEWYWAWCVANPTRLAAWGYVVAIAYPIYINAGVMLFFALVGMLVFAMAFGFFWMEADSIKISRLEKNKEAQVTAMDGLRTASALLFFAHAVMLTISLIRLDDGTF